jgi:GMP synthase-like glutamine amidotransferase
MEWAMRLGILQTGKVNDALVGQFGEYPDMFAGLYRAVDPSIEPKSYAVVDGEMPTAPGDADAWLITGSRHGVYDELPWIEPLKSFLRRARADGVPIIGVCFGHQIMAEAFGGSAEKSAKGWGVGVHEYESRSLPSWMTDAPPRIAAHVLHQDQVTAIPEDATCLASSPFCEYAMLAYGNAEEPEAISIQAHPEFDARFMRALLERLGGDRIPSEAAEAALASLGSPVASVEFVRWSLAWLRARREKSAAA